MSLSETERRELFQHAKDIGALKQAYDGLDKWVKDIDTKVDGIPALAAQVAELAKAVKAMSEQLGRVERRQQSFDAKLSPAATNWREIKKKGWVAIILFALFNIGVGFSIDFERFVKFFSTVAKGIKGV